MGWGGQEMRVFAELEWMRGRGHWVGVAADPASALGRHAQAAEMPFYPLRRNKLLLPFEVARLSAWLLGNHVDVVNTHSSGDGWLVGVATRLAADLNCLRRRKGPILVRSRHIEVDYPNRAWSRLAFRFLPRHVITTSKRIADRLVKELDLDPDRISCIATGVDPERFRPDVPGTLREELGLRPEIPLVGMISVLRSWKGHATFFEAAALLLQQREMHFIIAGNGPGREDLERKAARQPWKGHVTVLGYRADVPQILASLDALILPSYAHEGIPQIILQAQAMARPVIATTVGGIPEVVQDGVTGLLVPPRAPRALAEKISLVLDQPKLAQALGQKARAVAEKWNSLDAMGERLLELYGRIA